MNNIESIDTTGRPGRNTVNPVLPEPRYFTALDALGFEWGEVTEGDTLVLVDRTEQLTSSVLYRVAGTGHGVKWSPLAAFEGPAEQLLAFEGLHYAGE